MSNEDRTQDQTEGGQSASKQLSMQATTPPADVPGYRLERFLGSGAFGQVWVGRDLNTGRPVAIKFFLHRGGVNWSLLSHEVKNLVQLSADRHIVQVLEVGWDSDPPYYVMELVQGGSLEDMLDRRGAVPVVEAVELFRRICVGLNHSHSKGVLHCDLKPANILLGEDHEPRLADFGQSRMTHDQTPSLGTLFYMAPEQADLNSSPSSGWDVYAAGAILYRMITGGPPYRDDSIVEQLDTAGSLPKRLQRYRESIQQASPPVRHIQKSGVDRMLARIISRCLAADPNERFTNVQEILQELDRRREIQTRRPLMVLGVLGPLLLLIATSIFAVRTINHASEGTKTALRKEAAGANELAARFAARTLEGELDRYFRLCREELSHPEFRSALSATLQDRQMSQLLDEIAGQGTSAAAGKLVDTREALLDAPGRQTLQQYLADALQRYLSAPEDYRSPRLASLFVTDRSGTIFAIAYDRPVSRRDNSSGRNYSYRTYFHGDRNDLPKTTPIDSIRPLSDMHLSAAFQSTATGLWKVAISAPIYLDDVNTSADGERVPDAVFVVTINLGDFELPQGESGGNQVAVLVDAREGKVRGTVLHHPYMVQRSLTDDPLLDPCIVNNAVLDDLLRGDDVTYRDPVSEVDGAEEFAGDWLAAMQPVVIPHVSIEESAFTPRTDGDGSTPDAGPRQADLMVLVQYRLKKVFEPVDVMEATLIGEGAIALFSILAVSVSLWFFVRNIGGNHKGTKAIALASAATRHSGQLGSNGEPVVEKDTEPSVRHRAADMTETLETPKRDD